MTPKHNLDTDVVQQYIVTAIQAACNGLPDVGQAVIEVMLSAEVNPIIPIALKIYIEPVVDAIQEFYGTTEPINAVKIISVIRAIAGTFVDQADERHWDDGDVVDDLVMWHMGKLLVDVLELGSNSISTGGQ